MVEDRRVRQPVEQRRRALPGDVRPADVRELQPQRVGCRTVPGMSPSPSAPSCSVGASKSSCMPDGAEDRRVGRGALAQQLVQPACAQQVHPRRERPDAGKDQAVGGAQRVMVGGEDRARADPLDGLLDRPAVSRAVVHDPDRRAGARGSIGERPLRRRHAVLVGVVATAWAQRPGEGLEQRLDDVVRVRAALGVQVQRQAGRAGDGAEELVDELVVHPARPARRQVGMEHEQRPPGDVDQLSRTRLPSIGTTACP